MGEVVNLRRFRKAAARAAEATEAEANRRKFGRTKAERMTEAEAARRTERTLDGHRLDTARPEGDEPAR